MISDTLFDAIDEIEAYQLNHPECYDELKGDIEVVKMVMSGLQERLDQPPFEYPFDIAETLNADQRYRWRVTCEANIARWTERLRLLGPVTPDELIGKLDDAVKRQEKMLDEWTTSKALSGDTAHTGIVDEPQSGVVNP